VASRHLDWFRQADADLRLARHARDGAAHDWACFAAQQAAETLGIAYDDIKPQVVDTDSIGYTMVTGGSRTTFATGWAAILAAEDVKAQLVERAASIWEVPAAEVEYDAGVIRHKSEELSFTFRDLARQLYATGGGITDNLPRALPSGTAAEVDLASFRLPPLFRVLAEGGRVVEAEMLRTFNCGVGLVAVAAADDERPVLEALAGAFRLGEVTAAPGPPAVCYRGRLE